MSNDTRLSMAALVAIVVSGGMPAYAAESLAVQQGQPLEGGIQKIDLSLEHLRDVGLDLKQVTTSCRHLYDEVNQQPVSLMTSPSMIGAGTIINIPIGFQQVGTPAQPRKARVDQAMSIMTPIITTLKKNSDDFVSEEKTLDVSPEVQNDLTPLIQRWISGINDIAAQLNQLQGLTSGSVYDNASISTICSSMQQRAKMLDKVRGDAFKIIKKASKK
jgi:hypothetical protein